MCYADGTNAWTATDHTTYTLSSGSTRGVEILLPIYLESLFFPQLLDEHFLTEVHGVNSQNEDCGVVYCEMQGREQEEGDVSELHLFRLVFPGSNGFSCNTGGLLSDLRKPENNMAAIRDYHRATYRPDNAIVFVTGSTLDHAAVLKALEDVDVQLTAHVKTLPPTMERPFSTPLQPLVARTETASFPSDSEAFCSIEFAWRVPGHISKNLELMTQLDVLCDYLDDGISSPLYLALVDQPVPLASSVRFNTRHYAEAVINLTLSGVPSALAEEASTKALTCLKDLSVIDFDRMHSVISSSLMSTTSSFESNAASYVQDNLAVSFLYFELTDLDSVLFGEKERLEKLLSERCSQSSGVFWLGLLRKYLIDEPHVTL